MKKFIHILIFGFLIISCKTEIKNPNSLVIIEEGTQVEATTSRKEPKIIALEHKDDAKTIQTKDSLLGFWVGYFEKDGQGYEKDIHADEGFYWSRENKINISLNKITDSLVFGHSVVAGNRRPFEGSVKMTGGAYSFEVREPGNHRYDGEFTFKIVEDELIGTWTAFNNIEIKHRKYTLTKKHFRYDPNINLERSKHYVNWNKVIKKRMKMEYDDNEFEEWISQEFASATDLIYKINASNTLLEKSEVENLKKGDLTIIRNAIYARHGYSFKNRPLRVFFDAQSWYIPLHTNIKKEFTDLEKQNIQLLLRYEKNASEYYDYFGRG